MCSFTPHRIRSLSSDNHSDYWNINMEYKRCYRLLTFRLCWLFILQTLGCITRLNVHCAQKETLAEPQVTSRFDAAPERKLSWQQVTSQTSAQLQLFNCFPQAKKPVLISPSLPRLTPVFTLFTPTLSEPPIMSTNQTATEGKERGRLKHRRREREIQTASERIINAQCVFWCRRAEKCSGRRLMSSQTATLWCLKRRRNKKQTSPVLVCPAALLLLLINSNHALSFIRDMIRSSFNEGRHLGSAGAPKKL